MINFPCKCGFQLEVPQDQAGGLMNCPQCGSLNEVPDKTPLPVVAETESTRKIRFPCTCGHPFECPPEDGGRSIQCPKCGRLNDIPTVDELRNLDEDGTIHIADKPPEHDPERFAQLYRVYSKEKLEPDGSDIDLRQTMEQIEAAGTEPDPDEIPLAGETPRLPSPKYDPETGELIKAIDLTTGDEAHVNPADIPMAKPTLDYVRAHILTDGKRPAPPFLALLSLINLLTIFFAFMFQLAFTWVASIPFLGPFSLIALIPLLAHYANVVEDTGPDARDELPRLLRDFSFATDIWWPFCNTFFSLMYCFTPAVLIPNLFIDSTATTFAALAAVALGVILFPAVMLTSSTSGSIYNLRPDRVFQCLTIIGSRYITLVILFAVTLFTYFIGMVLLIHRLFEQFFAPSQKGLLFSGPIAYLVMFLGVYLMHLFCWHLGLTYRKYHDDFPWILQRFIPDKKHQFPRARPPRQMKSPRPAGWGNRLAEKTAEKSTEK
jgi:phage FluMu protein Com